MTRVFIPPEILAAAHERSAARVARDWPRADRLRGVIEAAGWRVVDAGFDFRLEPAHAPDVVMDGRPRYGRSEAVPSRATEPSLGEATVVVVVTGGSATGAPSVARAAAALVGPDAGRVGTAVVIVADGVDAETEAQLADLAGAGERPTIETVATSEGLGTAAAWNIGLRRATGRIVVILDAGVEITGDIVTPLARALEDEAVAVAGVRGFIGPDLAHLRPTDRGEATAIDGSVLAFRRADAIDRGPLDEAFTSDAYLDLWWSLVLRDEVDGRPRRAVVIPDLPVVVNMPSTLAGPRDRTDRPARRSFYRVLDRFGGRGDLVVSGGAELAADGP